MFRFEYVSEHEYIDQHEAQRIQYPPEPVQIGIGYSSDIPKAKKLLEQVINSEKGILKDKDILVVVKSLDESCVTLETRAWVNTADYWNVRFNLLERYKNIFDENGIEIPFNQLDVHMK